MYRLGFSLLLLAFGGCANVSPLGANRPIDSFAIKYSITDNPEQMKIFVSYKNDKAEPVCFGPENWPSNGILINDGSLVSLIVGNITLPLGAEQDYCPKCTTKVPPGSESVAYFKYESFKVPEDLRNADKKLAFRPVGFICH